MSKATSKKELPKKEEVIKVEQPKGTVKVEQPKEVVEVEQPVSEFAVREIMVQKQISREEAIEVLKTPSK